MPLSLTESSTCELTRARSTWTRPPWGELHGIRQEVPDDLLEPGRVARDLTGKWVEHLRHLHLWRPRRHDGGHRGNDNFEQVYLLDVEPLKLPAITREISSKSSTIWVCIFVAVDGRETLLQVLESPPARCSRF